MQAGSQNPIREYNKIWDSLTNELVQHVAAGQDEEARGVYLRLQQAYETACKDPKALEEFNKNHKNFFIDTINGVKRERNIKRIKGPAPQSVVQESKLDFGADVLLKEYFRNEIFKCIDNYFDHVVYRQDAHTLGPPKKTSFLADLFTRTPPKKPNMAEAIQNGDLARVREILVIRQRCMDFFDGNKTGQPCFFVTSTLQLPNSHLPRHFLQNTDIIFKTMKAYRSSLQQPPSAKCDAHLSNLREIIKCMCSMGVDINQPGRYSILSYAPAELIPLLLEQKADVDRRSEDENEFKALPIAYFAAKCDQQTVAVLINSRSKIRNINANDDNVLHFAINPQGMENHAYGISHESKIAFVQHFAKENPGLLLDKNKKHNIPLEEAIHKGYLDIVKELLKLHREYNKEPDENTKGKLLYFLIDLLNKNPRMLDLNIPGRERPYRNALATLKLLVLEWGEPIFSDPNFVSSLEPVVQQDLQDIIREARELRNQSEAKEFRNQKAQDIQPLVPSLPATLLRLVIEYRDGTVFINCDPKLSASNKKKGPSVRASDDPLPSNLPGPAPSLATQLLSGNAAAPALVVNPGVNGSGLPPQQNAAEPAPFRQEMS